MDYDDFKKRVEETRKKNFDSFQKHFNEAMKRNGDNRTLDDVMGDPNTVIGGGPLRQPGLTPPPEMEPLTRDQADQMAELFLEIQKETSEEDPRDIILRAFATYRAFIRHARAGGQVKFVREGQPDRVLKVRLK